MAGFSNFADYKNKVVDGGQEHSATFRKTTAVATVAGVWFDGSNMSGHPVTNFYASTPLESAVLLAREGIQHGSNVSPSAKYLKRVTAFSNTTRLVMQMTDTLMYYPFIDGDETAEQSLVNFGESPTAAAMPRYTDGVGVKAYLVAQGAYVGGARFVINYTNQAGVTGRQSRWCGCNTSTTAGTIVTSGTAAANNFGCFIPLDDRDTGIRSVQSITFETANGGIFALVLCKDLGAVTILEANIPAEKDFLVETGYNMPRIYDGAYLNFLICPNGSIAAVPIIGSVQTVWG